MLTQKVIPAIYDYLRPFYAARNGAIGSSVCSRHRAITRPSSSKTSRVGIGARSGGGGTAVPVRLASALRAGVNGRPSRATQGHPSRASAGR